MKQLKINLSVSTTFIVEGKHTVIRACFHGASVSVCLDAGYICVGGVALRVTLATFNGVLHAIPCVSQDVVDKQEYRGDRERIRKRLFGDSTDEPDSDENRSTNLNKSGFPVSNFYK